MEKEPRQEKIGLEMLSERFNWLIDYGESNQLRLLAIAMTEAGHTDVIDYLYEDQTRLKKVAGLFNIGEEILFDSKYVNKNEFLKRVEDYREGR